MKREMQSVDHSNDERENLCLETGALAIEGDTGSVTSTMATLRRAASTSTTASRGTEGSTNPDVDADVWHRRLPVSAARHDRRTLSIPERIETMRTMGWSIGSSRRNGHLTRLWYLGWVGRPWNARNMETVTAWNPTRMRNMILAVGPTTPAAVCWEKHSDSEDEDDDDDDDDFDDDDDMDDEYDDDENDGDANVLEGYILPDDGNDGRSSMAAGDNVDGNENDDGVDDANSEIEVEADENDVSNPRDPSTGTTQHSYMDRKDSTDDVGNGETESALPIPLLLPEDKPLPRKKKWSPSIRHGGCINTACWLNGLDCPWRLSTASYTTRSEASPHGVKSYETATQVMTSSDDRLIKVWDVSHAMGTASPLPGGWDTFAPFALGVDPADIGTQERYAAWRKHYRQYGDDQYNMAGSVRLLTSVSSGHQGNVFHATPLGSAPGKVLTCGADGSLRITDLNVEVSAVVVHPYAIDTDGAWEHLGSGIGGMAYSHLSLTANTGLLCSERGLHHFDLRLAPSAQNRRSLMPSTSSSSPVGENGHGGDNDTTGQRSAPCKTCAVWSPRGQHSALQDIEPNLVFVGGGSVMVELLDLRMEGFNKKVLQRYKPRCLSNNGDISVSGLDVSKDGRELLVSYESDQIYSFPIFPEVSCSAGPTLDDVDAAGAKFPDDPLSYLPELISYGGHLNRFTFLKNAKYAGPNDNYIVTGSDSGKAWIYERKTGAVVSLLGADASTCNGVIPHPTLPFFITYGIDSTAKIWRAALCVDSSCDDSRAARAKASLLVPYDISPVVLQADVAQATLNPLAEMKGATPDLVGTPNEVATIGRFAAQTCPEICGEKSARYGNAFRLLPPALRQGRYECYRGKLDRLRGAPVHQPLDMITARTSLNRLLHQATRLGLNVNPSKPWVLEGPQDVLLHVHKADLVPDTPSDWLLYDAQMTKTPLNFSTLFNLTDFRGILGRNFPDNATFFEPDAHISEVPWLAHHKTDQDADEEDSEVKYRANSRWLLYETATLLKEGGNDAVKERLFDAASRRYDKAIQYCAVAFMRHYEGSHGGLRHLSERMDVVDANATASLTLPATVPAVAPQGRLVSSLAVWSPLARLLITSRLNLSLVFIHPEVKQVYRAADQARFAVRLLSPFTSKKGKIVKVYMNGEESTEVVIKDDEPDQTFEEAKALEAKAYFRLGSAELDSGNYSGATKSFQASLQCLSQSTLRDKHPDPLVLKRLEEAKRKHQSLKKRASKKFRKLFSGDEEAT